MPLAFFEPITRVRLPSCFIVIYRRIASMIDMRRNSIARQKRELIHKCFVLAYQRAATQRLQDQAYRDCPLGLNHIVPESLKFAYLPEADPNFGGYTALQKYGEPDIELNNLTLLYEWKEELGRYPLVNVTVGDLFDYLMYGNKDYLREVHALLMEVDCQ